MLGTEWSLSLGVMPPPLPSQRSSSELEALKAANTEELIAVVCNIVSESYTAQKKKKSHAVAS